LLYGNCLVRKIIGFILVTIGVIMLICFMPYWMWLSILGLVLIIAGVFVLSRRY